jgi:tetratricopeptide (TPR) repeat protein
VPLRAAPCPSVPRIAPPQLRRLLALLERGEHGDETATLIADDPIARLLRAHALAAAGDFAAARDDCAAAVAAAPASAVVHVAAGLLAFVTRDHDLALERLIAAADLDPEHAVAALQLAAERAARLGWSGDARALLERLIAREPARLAWRLELERLLVSAQLPDAALLQIRVATELAPARAALWMERASLAAQVAIAGPQGPIAHREDEVADAVARACELVGTSPPPPPYLLAGAAALTQVGHLEAAEALLLRAPDDPQALLERAERALWRGDHRGADALARAASDAPAARLGVRRILGAIAVREGRFAEALTHLGQPGRGDSDFGSDTAGLSGDYRLHLWRGEALLRLDRRPEAHRALTAASMSSDGFLAVAWVLRLLLALRERRPLPGRDGEVRGLLAAISAAADEPELRLRGDVDADIAALERALLLLAGNRSTTPTVHVGGSLRRLGPIEGERRAAREALQRIRGGAEAEALAALDAGRAALPRPRAPGGPPRRITAVARTRRREPRRPEPGHRHLRPDPLGLRRPRRPRPARARPRLRPHHLRRRREDHECQHRPRVYMVRGEALLRLARPDEAIADLEQAVALSPGRLAAHIALALARQARGEPPEALAPLHRALLARAPGLCSDAARALGLPLWSHRDRLPGADLMQAVLEQALRMMQGNRSASLVTYRTAAGALRFVASVDDERPRRHAHSSDIDDLQRVRSLLVRAAGAP